jgi:outer membrane protein TolC
MVFVTLLLAAPAWSAPLTLTECLEQARRNNPSLRTSAWDSRIAEANVRLSSSTRYPRVDAQAGYTMQLEPQAVKINGFTAETQEPDFAFAGLSGTYTIYDFGRRDARISQARSLADSTADRFEARRSDVSLQVIEAYFGILEAGKLITAAEEEVAQVEQHRKIAQALFEEGVVTRNDVLQADVRLAAARQNLLNVKNRRENIWLRLNFLTGAEQSFRGELDEKAVMVGSGESNKDDQAAIDRRSEILALRKVVEANEADVKETRSNFYPEIFTRLALDYVQNDKVNEQVIMSATIGIKVNLFDGYASTSSRERAILSRSRNQDALRQTEKQVQLEIATARNDVQVAKDRIAVTETAIKQSEENLRINRERYQERVGTATEVLDAQTLLTQTKTDHYRAIFDHQVASARLKRAIGEL